MLPLLQEGRLQHARRACSWMQLGLFYYLKKRVLYSWRVKIVDRKERERFPQPLIPISRYLLPSLTQVLNTHPPSPNTHNPSPITHQTQALNTHPPSPNTHNPSPITHQIQVLNTYHSSPNTHLLSPTTLQTQAINTDHLTPITHHPSTLFEYNSCVIRWEEKVFSSCNKVLLSI